MKKLYITVRHDGLATSNDDTYPTCTLTNGAIRELFKKQSCTVTVLGHPEDMWFMAQDPHPFIHLRQNPTPCPRGKALLHDGRGEMEVWITFVPCDVAMQCVPEADWDKSGASWPTWLELPPELPRG